MAKSTGNFYTDIVRNLQAEIDQPVKKRDQAQAFMTQKLAPAQAIKSMGKMTKAERIDSVERLGKSKVLELLRKRSA